MNLFNTTMTGGASFQGTYYTLPVCLATRIATIDILKDEKVYEYINEMGEYFRIGMQEIFGMLGFEVTMIGEAYSMMLTHERGH